MTIRLILAFIIAFLVSSGIGAFLVPFLRNIMKMDYRYLKGTM